MEEVFCAFVNIHSNLVSLITYLELISVYHHRLLDYDYCSISFNSHIHLLQYHCSGSHFLCKGPVLIQIWGNAAFYMEANIFWNLVLHEAGPVLRHL